MTRIFKSNQEVLEKIDVISEQINQSYRSKEIHFIKLNNSGDFFLHHLKKKLEVCYKLHEIKYEKYAENSPSGEVKIVKDVEIPLFDKDVIIIDGLFVTGRTPNYILNLINARLPKSAIFCILAKKNQDLIPTLPIPYCAFDIDSSMQIIGCGIGDSTDRKKSNLIQLTG